MVNKQFEVLRALDKAKTQWYHFTTIVIAGMGIFTDAYDLFCIVPVTKLLGRLYYYDQSDGKPGVLPPRVNVAVIGTALMGTLIGQLFFGWFGDKLGRRKVYGVTLIIMTVSSVASGLSFGSVAGLSTENRAKAVITTLCFFRFWLGFGIGGDYPLTATIISEYANTHTRGAFIAAVFAMQGFGILTGAAVAIIVAVVFRRAPDPAPQADFVWRIIFMFGAVPAALTFYWRMRMPETARYTALVAGNMQRAALDMATVLNMQFVQDEEAAVVTRPNEEPYGLFTTKFLKRHGLHLLGTTTCWFFLDIVFYSNNLFQTDVLKGGRWLPSTSGMSAIEEVYQISTGQAFIAVCSTVPGYWVTVFTVDRFGRRFIQLQGFVFMSVFMLVISIWYDRYDHGAFFALYALTFFFANFGPNSTTFITPAELFPARVRSTCNGISAAAGKAGALLGAFGFPYAWNGSRIGPKKTLIMLAACNAAGLLFTFLLPETKGRSLEDISGENEDNAQAADVEL